MTHIFYYHCPDYLRDKKLSINYIFLAIFLLLEKNPEQISFYFCKPQNLRPGKQFVYILPHVSNILIV